MHILSKYTWNINQDRLHCGPLNKSLKKFQKCNHKEYVVDYNSIKLEVNNDAVHQINDEVL